MHAILIGRMLAENKQWDEEPKKAMELLIKMARLWYKINTVGFTGNLYKKGVLITDQKKIDQERARMQRKFEKMMLDSGLPNSDVLFWLTPKAGRF